MKYLRVNHFTGQEPPSKGQWSMTQSNKGYWLNYLISDCLFLIFENETLSRERLCHKGGQKGSSEFLI